MISTDTIKQVWYLHSVKNMSKSQIALKLELSRNSVIKILKDKSTVNAQFIKAAQKVERESNESLLKMLQDDDRIPSIASKILSIFNDDEQLKTEIKRNGLRPLATVIGVISDKVIKASELNLRVNSPESFVAPLIVNDADQVAKIKEERRDLINSEANIS